MLFVSHNMSTILSMSTRCLLLDRGRLVTEGMPQDVVRCYQSSVQDASVGQTNLAAVERYGNGNGRFASVHFAAVSPDGAPLEFAHTGCDLVFTLELRGVTPIRDATVALIIYDEMGNRLIDVNSLIKGKGFSLAAGETRTVSFRLRNVRLKPDLYTAALWLGIQNVADMDGIRYATTFRIEARREDILYTPPFPGVYMCEFDYTADRSMAETA